MIFRYAYNETASFAVIKAAVPFFRTIFAYKVHGVQSHAGFSFFCFCLFEFWHWKHWKKGSSMSHWL